MKMKERGAQLDDRVVLRTGRRHDAVGRGRDTVVHAVRARHEAGSRVRRTIRWVGELDHSTIVEHEPGVTVATTRILKPGERRVIV